MPAINGIKKTRKAPSKRDPQTGRFLARPKQPWKPLSEANNLAKAPAAVRTQLEVENKVLYSLFVGFPTRWEIFLLGTEPSI